MAIRATDTDYSYFNPLRTDYLLLWADLIEQNVQEKTSTLSVSARIINLNVSIRTDQKDIGYTLYVNDKSVHRGTIKRGNSTPGSWHQGIFENKLIVVPHTFNDNTESYLGHFNVKLVIEFDGEVMYDFNGDGKITGNTDEWIKFQNIEASLYLEAPSLTERAMIVDYTGGRDVNPMQADLYNTIWYSRSVNGYKKLALDIVIEEPEKGKMVQFTRELPNVPTAEKQEYNFIFTDEELYDIRAVFNEERSLLMNYYLTTTFDYPQYGSGGGYTQSDYLSEDIVFSILDSPPTISNAAIRDVNSTIVALTGDENVIVKGESMAEFGYAVTTYKESTLAEHSVTDGVTTIKDMFQGVIQDAQSGTFTFKAIDSRDLVTTEIVEKPFVNYIKPTCNQTVTSGFAGETESTVNLKITGEFYNGSFGAVDNDLILEVRYTQADGSLGDWVRLTDQYTPKINGNQYSLEISVNAFIYNQTYTFQSRAIDKLYTVITQSASTTIKPVFDWDGDDFNLNVMLRMNDQQIVLRHNAEADNTILAAGNRIYLRPNGTNDTEGEVIINNDGSLVLQGKTFVVPADYIVETGEDSMGSNGTWHWEKWASGKAVCYGVRNFGVMAVTTAWGNLYRSTAYTQYLPSGLFADAPEIININMVDSGMGGWIAIHETNNMSPTNTHSFIFVRPASATLNRSYISFHVIGRWDKEEE